MREIVHVRLRERERTGTLLSERKRMAKGKCLRMHLPSSKLRKREKVRGRERERKSPLGAE